MEVSTGDYDTIWVQRVPNGVQQGRGRLQACRGGCACYRAENHNGHEGSFRKSENPWCTALPALEPICQIWYDALER